MIWITFPVSSWVSLWFCCWFRHWLTCRGSLWNTSQKSDEISINISMIFSPLFTLALFSVNKDFHLLDASAVERKCFSSHPTFKNFYYLSHLHSRTFSEKQNAFRCLILIIVPCFCFFTAFLPPHSTTTTAETSKLLMEKWKFIQAEGWYMIPRLKWKAPSSES